jgi:hypothetical protein
MSDKPRPWPNHAKAARDSSAESAMRIVRLLEPLVLGQREFTETERLRRLAGALSEARKVVTLLIHQGAPIRPDDL